VYISSTTLTKETLTIVQYFSDLIRLKQVKSPLSQPLILVFDPELKNNKLDIKVSEISVKTRLNERMFNKHA